MSMSNPRGPRPRDDTERIEPLLALARRAGAGEVAEPIHREGKERLLTALAAERVLPPRRPWLLVAAAAAAMAAVVALVMRPAPPLGYAVSGQVDESGYFAPDREDAVVTFEDGSVVTLAPGARGRVAEVSALGARLSLERGRAHLSIVHRPEAEWLVEAGPYTVAVTGTAFSVSWWPDEKKLEVAMEQGSVLVRGPLAREGVALRAGQRLLAGGDELRIEAIAEGDAEAADPATAAPAAKTAEATPAPSAPPRARRSWSARIAAGEFDAVVREAEARGLEGVLSSAPLGDLVALADAARYVGRSALARRALVAQRERFAGSPQAATAAFLLGRMADEAGRSEEAIRFYDAHLSEGGAFSAEALGRKMVAEERLGRRDAARASARRYLQLHPAGPHAEAARALGGG